MGAVTRAAEEEGAVAGAALGVALTVAIALPGVMAVLWQPAAVSSGIPGVIAYINGVNLRQLVSVPTGLATALGVVFAVASGMACGPEGPTIHFGACVGAAAADFFPGIAGDGLTRRNMVALGAGAGVAAAFLAPMAGVVLVLEELAFISVEEIHKTFFACLAAYWTSYWLRAAEAHSASASLELEWAVGSASEPACRYTWWLIPCFVLLGAACGVVGALFNWINMQVAKARAAHWGAGSAAWRRAAEVVLLAAATALLFTLAPLLTGCRPRALRSVYDAYDEHLVSGGGHYCPNPNLEAEITAAGGLQPAGPGVVELEGMVQHSCEEGEYSPMGSLLFQPGPDAIKLLFQQGVSRVLPWGDVLLAFVLYFTVAVLTAGCALPTGLVVPYIFMGGCLGRMLGLAVQALGVHTDSSIFAIVGAGAMMSGSGRITLFMTVVMVEITNDLMLAPPIACATLTAVFVGNLFNHGYYHEVIHAQHMPLVEEPSALQEQAEVADVMASPAVTLRADQEAGEALREVLHTSHHLFPVVGGAGANAGDKAGRLVGLVSKDLLQRKEGVRVCEVMDCSPLCVRPTDALGRSLRLFRRMGCRTLPVVGDDFQPVGVLTRKDLQGGVLKERVRAAALEPGAQPGAQQLAFAPAPDDGPRGRASTLPVSLKGAVEEGKAEALGGVGGASNKVENPLFDQRSASGHGRGSSLLGVGIAPVRDPNALSFDSDLEAPVLAAVYLGSAINGLEQLPLHSATISPYRTFCAGWWRRTVLAASCALVALTLVEHPQPHWVAGTNGAVVGALCAELCLVAVQCADAWLKVRSGLAARSLLASAHGYAAAYAVCEVGTLLVAELAGARWERFLLWRPARFLRALFLVLSNRSARFVFRASMRCLWPVARVLSLAFFTVLLFALIGYGAFSSARDTLGDQFRFFADYGAALDSLGVAVTTANFPDVMMPYYNDGYFHSAFFLAFMVITTFLLMNVVLAVTFQAFSELMCARVVKDSTQRRKAVAEVFTALATGGGDGTREGGGARRVPKDLFVAVFETMRLGNPLPWRLPTDLPGAPPVAEVLYTASARSDPAAGLSYREFVHAIETLSHPLSRQVPLGSIGRPTHEVVRRVAGLRRLVSSAAFEGVVAVLLLLNGLSLGFKIYLRNQGAELNAINLINFIFSLLFFVELCLKAQARAVAWRSLAGVAEAAVIVLTVLVDVLTLGGVLVGFLNFLPLLRYLRFVRIGLNIKAYRVVFASLLGVAKAMGAFVLALSGVLHVFALVGMAIFAGQVTLHVDAEALGAFCAAGQPVAVPYTGEMVSAETLCTDNGTEPYYDPQTQPEAAARVLSGLRARPCYHHYLADGAAIMPCEALNPSLAGSAYESAGYFANNFNDWSAAIVTLFELMVVNNWMVVKDGFVAAAGRAANLYFYAYWIFAVVVEMSLLFAFTFESFISELELAQKHEESRARRDGEDIRDEFGSTNADSPQLEALRASLLAAEDALLPAQERRLMLRQRSKALHDIASVRFEDDVAAALHELEAALLERCPMDLADDGGRGEGGAPSSGSPSPPPSPTRRPRVSSATLSATREPLYL